MIAFILNRYSGAGRLVFCATELMGSMVGRVLLWGRITISASCENWTAMMAEVMGLSDTEIKLNIATIVRDF